MQIKLKKAKAVQRYCVRCPHCLSVNAASSWAVAHFNIEIQYRCPKCDKQSILPAYSLGGYGGRGN